MIRRIRTRLFFSGVCFLVQGFALPIDAAFPILSEYCQRSDKPWTERELRHKLEGAEAAPGLKRKEGHVLPRGCLVNSCGFKPSKAFREYHHIEPPKKAQFRETALSKFAGEFAGQVDLLWLAARSDRPVNKSLVIDRSSERCTDPRRNRSGFRVEIPERGSTAYDLCTPMVRPRRPAKEDRLGPRTRRKLA